MGIFSKIMGTHSERELKRVYPIVDKIEAMGPAMEKLSDEELRAKTDEFKKRLSEGETLDDLLVEAYAVVREAATRVLGMRHYRVQLIGGVILHQGRIAEMKTGEGKTLVSTLPAYLNALEGLLRRTCFFPARACRRPYPDSRLCTRSRYVRSVVQSCFV